MRLAVLKERRDTETRVAATPETVRKLVALGLTVAVEAGAGAGASIPDSEFSAAGASIGRDAAATLDGAGVVFAVQPPDGAARAALPHGALLVCISGAMADHGIVDEFAAAGIDVAAMELLPRITRAQSMDILSSQANLAGYRAVIEGAGAFDRGFPMMMTAAGTVPPARVFVVGAGVAGLQAIATARRLGAIVSATDVRPAAKEEIKSLGATFVGVEDTETAAQTGAYAKEMSGDFRRKQAELIAATVAKNDMVICTALVQGGKAPVIVTQSMVDAMKPGSVVVDIAADGGGNCEATRPGEAYVTERGVKILGYRNWPGRISVAASTLYAKNLLTFLTTFWDKERGAPNLPQDDAIIKGVMLTRGGAVVHANFAPPPPEVPPPEVRPAVTDAPEVPAEAPNSTVAEVPPHAPPPPAVSSTVDADDGTRLQDAEAAAPLGSNPAPSTASNEALETPVHAAAAPARNEPQPNEDVTGAEPISAPAIPQGDHEALAHAPQPEPEALAEPAAIVAQAPQPAGEGALSTASAEPTLLGQSSSVLPEQPDAVASPNDDRPEHEAAALPPDPAIAPQASAETAAQQSTGPGQASGSMAEGGNNQGFGNNKKKGGGKNRPGQKPSSPPESGAR